MLKVDAYKPPIRNFVAKKVKNTFVRLFLPPFSGEEPDIFVRRHLRAGTNSDMYAHVSRNLNQLTSCGAYPPKFFKNIKGKRILDVGCCNGEFVIDLNELGAKAYGIDKDYVETEQKYRHLFKVADALSTGLPDNYFDQIYSSFSVFSFMLDDSVFKEKCLIELKRILKKKGKIRLGVVFSKEQMENIAKKVGGLKITDQDTTGCSWIELTKV